MKGTSTQPGDALPVSEHEAISGDQRELVDQLLDKWGLLILAALCHRPRRFNELVADVDGVTRKALTQALRRLERNGIIARTVLRTRPLAVEYSITSLGRTLESPFAVLRAWTQEHFPEVKQHREAFDADADDPALPRRPAERVDCRGGPGSAPPAERREGTDARLER